MSLVFTHTRKQILFLDFLRSQRKRADRGQFWPSPKKWLHSAKPMYGRYASSYSSIFDGTLWRVSAESLHLGATSLGVDSRSWQEQCRLPTDLALKFATSNGAEQMLDILPSTYSKIFTAKRIRDATHPSGYSWDLLR